MGNKIRRWGCYRGSRGRWVSSLQFHFSNNDIQFCTTKMFCGFDAEIENVTTTKHTQTYNNNWNVTIALRNFLNHQKIPLDYYKCKQIIAACALITQKQRDIMQQRSTECLYVCMYEAHEKWNVARLNTNKISSSSHNNNKESIANKLLPRWLAACLPASLSVRPASRCQLSSSGRQCSISSKVFNFHSTHTDKHIHREREAPGQTMRPMKCVPRRRLRARTVATLTNRPQSPSPSPAQACKAEKSER